MEDLSSMKSSVQSVVCTTARSSHGRPAPYPGEASSLLGDGLVVASSLIWLLLVSLAIASPVWIFKVYNGLQSSRSMISGSPRRPGDGGTAND